MDKIRCRYALIGFTPDLTDPASRAVPIGVVAGCEAADGRGRFTFLFSTTRAPVDDPIARELVAGFPKTLREQVALGLQKYGTEKWTAWLTEQMNQTVHVTQIAETIIEAPLDNYQALVGTLIERFQGILGTPEQRQQRIRFPHSSSSEPLPAFALEPVPAGTAVVA